MAGFDGPPRKRDLHWDADRHGVGVDGVDAEDLDLDVDRVLARPVAEVSRHLSLVVR